MSAAEKEPLPQTPEAKEKYFMEQVAAGESLCNKGKRTFWYLYSERMAKLIGILL